MSDSISVASGISKKEKYEQLIPQIAALVDGEADLISNLANVVAALKEGMNFFWVGFYFVQNNWLVLRPFQGPVACTRIGFGKGVCGASWQKEEIIIVKNVDEFPGHIACNSLSKSEIVLPIFKDGKVTGVLDVDSDKLNDFDETDSFYLQQVIVLIEKML